MTTWQYGKIELDDKDRPKWEGTLELHNDKGEEMACIVWFDPEGPFYASAMDGKNPDVIRRIGPCETLESAKRACERMMTEGR